MADSLNQQNEMFSAMSTFSLDPKRLPEEEWPGQTVNCDHRTTLSFFQIICSRGKQLCLLLWTHKHPRKNIQNSAIDK